MEETILYIYKETINKEIDVASLEEINLDMDNGFDSIGIVEFIVAVSTEVDEEVDVLLEKFFSSSNLLEFSQKI